MIEEINVQEGQTIIRQGEQGSGFYILKSGTLEVYRDDILLAVLMYPGTIFGEMADILGRERSCTVKAKNAATIELHEFTSLEDLMQNQPDVAIKLVRTLASRLDRTTQKLVETVRDNPFWPSRAQK